VGGYEGVAEVEELLVDSQPFGNPPKGCELRPSRGRSLFEGREPVELVICCWAVAEACTHAVCLAAFVVEFGPSNGSLQDILGFREARGFSETPRKGVSGRP
jgi:hypothetical protein